MELRFFSFLGSQTAEFFFFFYSFLLYYVSAEAFEELPPCINFSRSCGSFSDENAPP